MGYLNTSDKNGFVYILSNYKRTVLYIGVTSELDKRILNHKSGKGSDFTSKYNCKILLYFERYANINKAIEREKQLKNWHRKWKFNLIKKSNPELMDLWEKLK